MIREYDWMGLNLTGYLDDSARTHSSKSNEDVLVHVLGPVEDVRYVVERRDINDVVIALPQRAYNQINDLVLALHDLPVQVRVVPDYFSLALYRASVDDFGGLPMINLRDPALNDVQRLLKRAFDLSIAGVFLLLAMPFMLLIALLIKLEFTRSGHFPAAAGWRERPTLFHV
ncbi:MAG: hypothetical protein R3C44_03100 [Chloroflexota bacterium]